MMIASIAEAFHVLPTQVARDLDDDPELLSAECLKYLKYRDAKAAYDRAKSEEDLESWKGNKTMDAVITNDFKIKNEKR